MPFYEKQPYIQPLHQLIKEVMVGEILVPRFQRKGTEETWTPEQRGQLLDSLFRGYPVGTILLWSTTTEISIREVIGGFTITKPSNLRVYRYLLDGHQRLSTVVQILGPGLLSELVAEGHPVKQDPDGRSNGEEWVLDLSVEEDSATRFRCLRRGESLGDPGSSLLLPLKIIFDRTLLNRWIRNKHDLSDEQMRKADNVRDRLREYAMPIAVLVAQSLEEATESFKRINSAGTPMDIFNMVSALSYKEGFDPQERFEHWRTELLEPLGWQDVLDSDLLRICAGTIPASQMKFGFHNPAKMNIQEVSQALRDNPKYVEQGVRTVIQAVGFLEKIGVLGPEALPYSWQLITLAITWCRHFQDRTPTPADYQQIEKWFWLTTYGQAYAGINSAVFDRCSMALQELIERGSTNAMERDLSRKVVEVERFDFRAARAKACILAMARLQDHDNERRPAHHALREGNAALQVIQTQGQRSTWWHMVIQSRVENESIKDCRELLRRIDRRNGLTEEEGRKLMGLGLDPTSHLSGDDMMEARRNNILEIERKKVMEIGLQWD